MHQKSIQYGKNGPFSSSSANLDYHSLVHNSEGACFVWGAREAKTFSEMLDADFARANVHRLTKEELEADSAISRAKQWAIRKLLINYL